MATIQLLYTLEVDTWIILSVGHPWSFDPAHPGSNNSWNYTELWKTGRATAGGGIDTSVVFLWGGGGEPLCCEKEGLVVPDSGVDGWRWSEKVVILLVLMLVISEETRRKG